MRLLDCPQQVSAADHLHSNLGPELSVSKSSLLLKFISHVSKIYGVWRGKQNQGLNPRLRLVMKAVARLQQKNGENGKVRGGGGGGGG